MDSGLNLRLLLRCGADDRQHHRAVFLRQIRREPAHRRHDCGELWAGEFGVEAWRRNAVGFHGEEVWDEGEVVDSVGGADVGWAFLHLVGEGGVVGGVGGGAARLLRLRSGCVRADLRGRSVRVEKVTIFLPEVS